MRLAVFVFVASVLAASHPDAAEASPARLPRDEYVLRATLVPEADRVDGTLTLRVCAPNGSRPLRELWFHSYLNAFASDRSVFRRENAGHLRGVTATRTGSLEIVELRVDDLPRTAAIDYPGADRTTFRVALASPLEPNACANVRIAFRSHMPNLWARTGRAGDFFVVAQWFPKLAKLDGDGTWHADAYHGFGEFFADFADYELHVTTPAGWTAVTSTDANGRIEGATDVVWVASREFVERHRTARHVNIRGVAHPSVSGDLDRTLDATEHALRVFSHRYGAYRWPNLTVVVPPRDAAGGAAMEYPSLIVTEPSADAPLKPFVRDVESTVFHEMAHQWFYASLASDEVRSPWLDEGPATWIAGDLLDETGGWLTVPLRVSTFSFHLDLTRGLSRITPPPISPSSAFGNEDAYGLSVYVASSALFETLARTNGRPWLRAALSSYARANATSHPTDEDLLASLRGAATSQYERAAVEAAIDGFTNGNIEAVRATELSLGERVAIASQRSLSRACEDPRTTTATLAFAGVAIVAFGVVLRRIRRS